MTPGCQFLADTIHILLQLGIVVDAVVRNDLFVVAAPLLDFLGLRDDRKIAFAIAKSLLPVTGLVAQAVSARLIARNSMCANFIGELLSAAAVYSRQKKGCHGTLFGIRF